MILEHPIPPFLEWIGGAALNWALAVLALSALAFVVCFVLLLVFKGTKQAGTTFRTGVREAWKDLAFFSWKRCFAVAGLAIRESIRKKVVVVGVVFLILLMFAGWFLDPDSKDPARLCASFVYQTTTYLVLLLALFLSSLSLPGDFKTKTIYTLVTKPVRSSEIVLGRILGIGAVGSVILVLMAFCSYFFVSNTLKHTHVLNDAEDLTYVTDADPSTLPPDTVVAKGYTRLANGHKHQVEKYASGELRVFEENKHTHPIEQSDVDGVVRYKIGTERGSLQAKVPVYGSIKFRNADSFERERGINVGEEWDYRSYIAGATDEAVIWTFDGVSPKKFPEGLPVEMTISVFRTHMGNIEKTIMGALYVRNPVTGLTAETHVFNSEKYTTKALTIPVDIDKSKVKTRPWVVKKMGDVESFDAQSVSLPSKESYNLFDDFVVDGKLEIWLQCLDNQQYFGAAGPDLYLRSADANVFFNFFKGYLGVWQQMLIVIAFGVLFSTFLSGPVAMASTFGILIAGYCKPLFLEIAHLQSLGGGPIESFNRLISHENMMIDLPNTFSTHLGQTFDQIAGGFLSVIGLALPSFSDFNYYADCVANGYSIPWNSILVHIVTTLSFVAPLFIFAYVILRNREVAKQ
ncbi:MAG: hypothetical protein IKX88_11550 [Thermoguttaceae bacterium]|nr:hypothetical protein [Thermoguttaceae bacterium]